MPNCLQSFIGHIDTLQTKHLKLWTSLSYRQDTFCLDALKVQSKLLKHGTISINSLQIKKKEVKMDKLHRSNMLTGQGTFLVNCMQNSYS